MGRNNKYIEQYKVESISVKKRLIISMLLLVLVAALTVAASFAWLSLSARPTVENITTTVTSNGALEIALLSTGTYENPGLIESGIGASLDIPNSEEANLRWGSLIDLSSEIYGLNKISLYPSVLNAKKLASGRYNIGTSILQVPKFSFDGRITTLDVNSVSGVCTDDEFLINTNRQTFGVRAIGTADTLTIQQKILISSRSSLTASSNSAKQTMEKALEKHGAVIFDIQNRHYFYNEDTISTKDISELHEFALDVSKCLDDIEYSIRQGLIAIIASEIEDTSQFEQTYNILSNADMPLNRALSFLPISFSGEAAITNWVNEIDSANDNIRSVAIMCEALQGGSALWDDLEPFLALFADMEKVYYGESPFRSSEKLAVGTGITLMPDSGILSVVSDYIGQYSAYAKGWFNEYAGNDHEIIVRNGNSSGYIALLSGIASNLESVANEISVAEIGDICGFAIDIAFRVNADDAVLLLKTEENEIDPYGTSTRRGGSYMDFSSDTLDENALLTVIDAVRVTFIDVEGNILGMAKINLRELETIDGEKRAPICIYEYGSEPDSSVLIDNLIALPKNIPVIVTAIVWLDGNEIDNSAMSSAGASVNAVLNLQFATNVELVPANS